MPWLSERIIDPGRAGSLAARLRARRWETFIRRFPEFAQMSVLDLGGTAGAWRLVPARPARLVLLNIAPPGELEGAQSAIGDACDPPDWVRRERFDLVFSNSLIEHVGGHWRRERFAEVVRDRGERYWIQTPNRYFPLEPHYVAPLFQFVPLAARAWLVARWPVGSLATVKDPAVCLAQAQQTELVGRTEMRGYFPDAEMLDERVLGVSKSLIALR
jgi:hypothetical protein